MKLRGFSIVCLSALLAVGSIAGAATLGLDDDSYIKIECDTVQVDYVAPTGVETIGNLTITANCSGLVVSSATPAFEVGGPMNLSLQVDTTDGSVVSASTSVAAAAA